MKIIPPPPPVRKTRKRSRVNTMRPSTIAQNMRSRSNTEDPVYDKHREARRMDQLPPELRTLPGSPQHIVSNMPAVSSALGMMGEKQAKWKVERDLRSAEYNGRTSKLVECGPTARKTDNERAAADGK